jgi:hypothetical protein
MRILWAAAAFVLSTSVSYANEPVRLAQAAEQSKPTEAAQTQSSQSQPKKKPVAKKRETDEQKARRIGRKYGVTW